MPTKNHHLSIFGRAHNPNATYQGKKGIDTLSPEKKIFEVLVHVPYMGLVAILNHLNKVNHTITQEVSMWNLSLNDPVFPKKKMFK